jgi:hypothetical protein
VEKKFRSKREVSKRATAARREHRFYYLIKQTLRARVIEAAREGRGVGR